MIELFGEPRAIVEPSNPSVVQCRFGFKGKVTERIVWEEIITKRRVASFINDLAKLLEREVMVNTIQTRYVFKQLFDNVKIGETFLGEASDQN